MSDQFNVTVTPDKSAYNQGDTANLVLTGEDVVTSTVTEQVNISGTVTNPADGSVGPFGPIPVTLSKQQTEHDSVVFQSVTDDKGNTWTVAADGLHASAVLNA